MSTFHPLIALSTFGHGRRGQWREQRSGGNNNRRGGGGANNYKQNQYAGSRATEHPMNNRQQQQSYNARAPRTNRYPDNRSPHDGREQLIEATNDEATRHQRMNSGNFSQGQQSGPTSPSTAVPARTIYPSHNRPAVSRNSPAPYAGSSSSRTNSLSATSPPANQPSGNNRMGKRSTLSKSSSRVTLCSSLATFTSEDEQQPIKDESNSQRSLNNPSNPGVPNRSSQSQAKYPSSSNNSNTSATLAQATHDEQSLSSHETGDSLRSDVVMSYAQSMGNTYV